MSSSVSDPYYFFTDPDPDPTKISTTDPDPDPTPYKVMKIFFSQVIKYGSILHRQTFFEFFFNNDINKDTLRTIKILQVQNYLLSLNALDRKDPLGPRI